SHASHSHRMEGMLEELERVAAELSFSEPRIPVVSNLTGRPLSAEQLADPGYWADHVRHTVRYADGVRWLSGQGVENFLELGPDGVLSPMCMECLADDPAASDALAVPVMRRGRSETRTLLSAIGALWTRGVAFDWTALFADWDARRVALPTYAFQRRRHWLGGPRDQAPASSTRDATTATAGRCCACSRAPPSSSATRSSSRACASSWRARSGTDRRMRLTPRRTCSSSASTR